MAITHWLDQYRAGGVWHILEFTTAGTYNNALPAGVTYFRYIMAGAGAGGATGGGGTGGAGGGGGEIRIGDQVTNGQVDIVVGAHGTGGGSPTDGADSTISGAGLAFTITARGGDKPSGYNRTGGLGGGNPTTLAADNTGADGINNAGNCTGGTGGSLGVSGGDVAYAGGDTPGYNTGGKCYNGGDSYGSNDAGGGGGASIGPGGRGGSPNTYALRAGAVGTFGGGGGGGAYYNSTTYEAGANGGDGYVAIAYLM